MSAVLLSTLANKAIESNWPIVGVGVDIEFNRKLNTQISKFFVHEQDEIFFDPKSQKSLLTLWTIKEALFKATPDNGGLSLRDFAVLTYQKNSGVAYCLKNDSVSYFFSNITTQDTVGAISVCVAKH